MNRETIARFWSLVDRVGPDECWPWTGSRNRKGYGLFREGSRWIGTANHIALELARGLPLPPGVFACHTCDHPWCCNPRHLFPGDNAANMSDAHRKGRISFLGEKGPRARLREAQVVEIRKRYAAGAWGDELAQEFGVATVTIKMIVSGRIWPAAGGPRTRGRRAQRNHKLTAAQALLIQQRRAAGERGADLAREFGVSPQLICGIHKGRCHLG